MPTDLPQGYQPPWAAVLPSATRVQYQDVLSQIHLEVGQTAALAACNKRTKGNHIPGMPEKSDHLYGKRRCQRHSRIK